MLALTLRRELLVLVSFDLKRYFKLLFGGILTKSKHFKFETVGGTQQQHLILSMYIYNKNRWFIIL